MALGAIDEMVTVVLIDKLEDGPMDVEEMLLGPTVVVESEVEVSDSVVLDSSVVVVVEAMEDTSVGDNVDVARELMVDLIPVEIGDCASAVARKISMKSRMMVSVVVDYQCACRVIYMLHRRVASAPAGTVDSGH